MKEGEALAYSRVLAKARTGGDADAVAELERIGPPPYDALQELGVQRIIAWEAPLMGWRFVWVRVIPSLAFPVVAGWLVATFYHE